MIYNSIIDAKIGLNAVSKTQASLTLDKANMATSGVIVLSHVTDPISIVPSPYIQITRQDPAVDVLSKTITIEFDVTSPLPRDVTQVLTIEHPELGAIEILRAELYTASNSLLPIYSEPFAVKLSQ